MNGQRSLPMEAAPCQNCYRQLLRAWKAHLDGLSVRVCVGVGCVEVVDISEQDEPVCIDEVGHLS